jgi:hypothetical protein
MLYRLITKLFICMAIGFFIVSFSTDLFAGGSLSIQWGEGSKSDNREVSKKHKKQGPPAHAPAHGYRAKHQYRITGKSARHCREACGSDWVTLSASS